MKKSSTRLVSPLASPSLWLLSGSLFAFGFGLTGTFVTSAQAQGKGKMGGKRNAGLTRKMLAALQEKTGKPLTPELRAQLTTLAKTRADAIEAANEKFYADFAAATGVTVDQAREITTPARGAGKMGKNAGGDMAPVPAPAAAQ